MSIVKEKMMTNSLWQAGEEMMQLWLVEERDITTGNVKYSQTFRDYTEALTVFNEKKKINSSNTLVLEQYKKQLLNE